MPFIHLIAGVPEPYRPPPPPAIREVSAVATARGAAPVEPGSASGPGRTAEAAYRHSAEAAAGADRQPAVLARQIMTASVVTLPPDAALAEAWEIVRRRRFRHVPVLTREGRLVGILSDRDLFRAGEGRPGLRVADAMSTRVLTATPDTEIREVARVLVAERIGCLPIVGPAHELVGILTTTDVLRCVVHHAPLELWV